MAPVRLDPAALVRRLPRGGRVLVMGCATESQAIADAVMAAGRDLGGLTFTGVFVPGINRCTYLANADCRVETFFMTPELKAAGPDRVRFLPLCYDDIRKWLAQGPIDAAIMMVSPPDDAGLCSFGVTVDFLAELWPQIPLRLAHINPQMPRTVGHEAIPFDALDACVELSAPLYAATEQGSDDIPNAIASHIAPHVKDGATLQMGLGKVPGAVLRALTERRGLKVHSGLISDAVLDLLEAGALADGVAVTAGCAIGSRRLYDMAAHEAFQFSPVAVTHSVALIGGIPDFVSINSTMEVDLLGQCHSEIGANGLASGPGGATDYSRAARLSPGGLRIVALPASAGRGAITRVVPAGQGAGPVSLGRMDVDLVVTEHGAADLRGKAYHERAEALIAIAASDHRDALTASWRDYSTRF